MKFLLTNDDGIEAPGLAALEQAVQSLGSRVVVAPHCHRSGCSHQATTHAGLTLSSGADDRHALDGLPVDCTRVGLLRLAPDADWVIAGVNEGGNLGCDVWMSGTVAAAREAALWGKPAMAISQYRRTRQPVDWRRAARWAMPAIGLLLERGVRPRTFWNVNLPDPESAEGTPQIVFCPVDPHPLPVSYRLEQGVLHYQGAYQDRSRETGHDVDHCFAGRITISEISLACCLPIADQ